MDLREQPVVFEVPGDDRVEVQKGVEIEGMRADVYTPRGAASDSVVMMVSGYAEEGYRRVLGCSFLDMRHTVSWARLFAGSGFTAIAYANREPIADAAAAVRYARSRFRRVAVWASSGSVPVGLSAVREADCGAFLYGYTLDVADAASQFHFANPALGVDDVRWDIPLFLARAGQDTCPGLNAALDRFIAEGLKRGLPLTLINHPTAPHAFDLFDDSETTRHVVQQTIEFLRFRIGRA
ncbi:MAG TPA: hypothetical protein VF381_07065 [Thermoanaerobaculia bacterium]